MLAHIVVSSTFSNVNCVHAQKHVKIEFFVNASLAVRLLTEFRSVDQESDDVWGDPRAQKDWMAPMD